MSVVQLRSVPRPEPTPAEAFQAARQAMLETFQAWLRTNPNPDDVAAEVDGTGSVLAQLRAIEAFHG